MRIAGVKEFRDIVPEAMKGDEAVLVTRHGKIAALLVPLSNIEELPEELREELRRKLGEEIAEQLRQKGITEEKILKDFNAWRKARHTARSGH